MSEPVSEQRLQTLAASFPYPQTPDVSGGVRRRLFASTAASRQRPLRLAWALLVALLLVAALLAVPAVRAAVFEFLQIGAIRIRPVAATATPAATTTAGSDAVATAVASTATPTRTLLDVAGATTWEAVQAKAASPLRLPAYPPGLGLPDEVYQQQVTDPGLDEPVTILVWRDPAPAGEVRLALYQIGLPYYGLKVAPLHVITEVRVNDTPAFWVSGPHEIRLNTGAVEEWLFVEGNVLIWTEGEITYRLEGATSVEEAIDIAESLPPR